MNARVLLLLVGVLALGGALLWSRRAGAVARSDGSAGAWPADLEVGAAPLDVAEAVSEVAETALDALDDFTFSLVGYRVMSARWELAATKPEHALYVTAMREAEARYGLPAGLGVRLMWQESRFDPNAFNARSGASGIMQIVPRWHPDVNPFDALAAIDYGVRYLVQLFRQFGTWEYALMGYNWGPGNVAKWIAGGHAGAVPLETQNYAGQILADVRATGVMA